MASRVRLCECGGAWRKLLSDHHRDRKALAQLGLRSEIETALDQLLPLDFSPTRDKLKSWVESHAAIGKCTHFHDALFALGIDVGASPISRSEEDRLVDGLNSPHHVHLGSYTPNNTYGSLIYLDQPLQKRTASLAYSILRQASHDAAIVDHWDCVLIGWLDGRTVLPGTILPPTY